MAEVAVPRQMFQEILSLIAGSGRRPRRHDREIGEMRRPATAEVRLDLKAKRRLRPCEAKRLVILAVNRSAAIEFRCGAPR
jgi:hypothetical protein